MKKRILSALSIIFVIWMFAVPVSASTVYTEGYLEYTIEDNAVSICGYFGKKSEVTIPDRIAGYPVSVIASGAFSDSAIVKNVYLPDTIMKIEEGAFNAEQTVIYNSNTDEPTTAMSDNAVTDNTSNRNTERNTENHIDNSNTATGAVRPGGSWSNGLGSSARSEEAASSDAAQSEENSTEEDSIGENSIKEDQIKETLPGGDEREETFIVEEIAEEKEPEAIKEENSEGEDFSETGDAAISKGEENQTNANNNFSIVVMIAIGAAIILIISGIMIYSKKKKRI